MRKILGNPALEQELAANAVEEQRRVALESMSLEEQHLMTQEADDCANQVSNDLQEVNRVTEVSDALEDLAVVASSIEQPTQGEKDLMGTAAQMAVAGTDIDPEEVVPAMEGYEDWKKSAGDFAERVKAKAKEIWEKIMAFLKRIWGKIQEFFYRIFDSIPSLQKRLEEQIKRLRQAKDKGLDVFGVGANVRLNVGAGALTMVGGGVAKDADQLKLGFHSLLSYSQYIFGKYADAVRKRGDDLAKAIGDFKWDNALVSADGVVDMARHNPIPLPQEHARSAGTQGDYLVTFTKGALGGMELTHKVATAESIAQANSLRRMELYRGEGVEITRGPGSDQGGSSYEVAVLHADAATGLLKDALAVLKKLDDWKKTGLKALIDTQKKLEKASDTASDASKRSKDSIPKDIDVALYRGALNFNTAFARWSSEPSATFTRGALASVRALSLLVDKSLDMYGANGGLAGPASATAATTAAAAA